ncbi:uncharacterized protein [Ptychodera flava]|uniref:uncharacterized protein n=1 Tax=Ptychodera flava TaxID=63121 RepID=UPI00396A0F43
MGVYLDKVWTTDKLPISENSIPSVRDTQRWSHLKDVQLPELKNKEVTILIGNDVPEAHWILEERRGGRKQPYAVKTLLGWTLIGPMAGSKTLDANVNYIKMDQALNCENSFQCAETISSILQQMYNTDFSESLHDTRFDTPTLPNNKQLAEKRLHLLKRRLLKDDTLLDRYSSTMEDYISQGHARRVPKEENVVVKDQPVWYLPHHPVINPHKPDKCRVVFDCAAKYGGTSLNDQLLQGPDMTNSLIGVLLRFRQDPVALVADIKQMFHQVRVDPSDCDVLRFLWWPNGDLTKDPIDHQMLVHLFGATSSPSCASYALRRTADDNRGNFDSDIINSVYRNFYVDDFLKSVLNSSVAKKFVEEITSLLSEGGFQLTKWISNSREVLSSIPAAERAPSVMNLDLSDLPVDRALGLQWDVEEDVFKFKVGKEVKDETRRGLLSVVASVYDPLGLVAPFILPAKQILQQLCKIGYNWDEKVPEEYLAGWQRWYNGILLLRDIAIPRCYKPQHFGRLESVELHHFSDASMEGYGVASYLRLVDVSGSIHCCLIVGKSRVAPMKTVTIPRLELTAATVSAKISKQLHEELQLPIHQEQFWTDSTIVLQYIRNSTRRFQTFVANRIQVIHDASTPSQWHHVPSELNPADCASRGIQLDHINGRLLQLWYEGPQFLWQPRSSWPTQPTDLPEISEDDKELKKAKVYAMQKNTSPDDSDSLESLMYRCSSWYKLQKSVAWLLRYKRYLSTKYGRCNGGTIEAGRQTVQELTLATKEIVKLVQKKAFPQEITTMKPPSGRRDSKGYISPLIHIEVSHSLSTDSFIQAIWRFISRRGPPVSIYSDNGTNFRGAEEEVKKALQKWNQDKITDSLHSRNIQWYFNPPAASHTGGVWERMIRSVKRILRSLMSNQLVDDETLLTLLSEVERILNDRPLVQQSDDPNDMEVLTPNSLLLLRRNPCTSSDLPAALTLHDRRRQAQRMADNFWQRWTTEYLPSLQQRQKWLRPRRNLVPGDLVIIMDENQPRGYWLKGVIQHTFPDRYGNTRQVIVKTANGVLRRDVRKLCLLEEAHTKISEDDPVYGYGSKVVTSTHNGHMLIFHCIQQSKTGGESVFADGFKTALQLKEEDPAAFEILSNTHCDFMDKGVEIPLGKIYNKSAWPIFSFDRHGNLAQVHFNNPVRDTRLRMPVEKVYPFYKVITTYNDIIHREENTVIYRMQPGELLMFDNSRVLYGRNTFEVREAGNVLPRILTQPETK